MAARSAPAGPPRRRLSEDERRAQIIRGCVRVLATEGYRNASLARIAEAAGVSKGLVSHYFDDHSTLMEQTAIATANFLRDEVSAAIDTGARVPEVVRAAVRSAAHLQETHGEEMRAITQIAHNLRRDDGSPVLDLSVYAESYRAQRQLFERGQREGDIGSFDTQVMAVFYQGAIDTMLAYLDAHPEVSRDEYAEQVADLLLRSMGAGRRGA